MRLYLTDEPVDLGEMSGLPRGIWLVRMKTIRSQVGWFFQTLAAGTWAKLVGPGASSGEGTQWF